MQSEALLGYEFAVRHLDDRVFIVRSTPGHVTAHDDIVILEGEGMPIYKSPSHRGDLYLKLSIVMPSAADVKESKVRQALQEALPRAPTLPGRPAAYLSRALLLALRCLHVTLTLAVVWPPHPHPDDLKKDAMPEPVVAKVLDPEQVSVGAAWRSLSCVACLALYGLIVPSPARLFALCPHRRASASGKMPVSSAMRRCVAVLPFSSVS